MPCSCSALAWASGLEQPVVRQQKALSHRGAVCRSVSVCALVANPGVHATSNLAVEGAMCVMPPNKMVLGV